MAAPFVYLVDGLLHHVHRVGLNQSRDFFPDFENACWLLAFRQLQLRFVPCCIHSHLDPGCPKSSGAPTGTPRKLFFSTSKFSIADWEGGNGTWF
jgi:hypothetical protein